MGFLSLGVPAFAGAQEGEGGDEEEAPAEPTEGAEVGGEATDGAPLVGKQTEKRRWGVGARLRYVFIPQAVLNLFLDHSTSMNSIGFGVEVVGRKGDFDIVFGLEYDGASPENGLYQEKGENPSIPGEYPDFTEFDGLGMIGLDASFIWHAKMSDKVQLRYGAGIGLGIVTGTIYQTDTVCPPGTTVDDLDDSSQCAPLAGSRAESDDVPPIVPIINVQLGARFMLSENISFNVETGFRDVFYLGLGTDYIF